MCQEDKPIRDDHTSITLDHTIQTADKRPTKNKQATKLWSNWFHSDKIKINLQNMKQWWKIKFFKEAHEKPGHTVHAALCLLFETIYLFWKTYKRNQVFFYYNIWHNVYFYVLQISLLYDFIIFRWTRVTHCCWIRSTHPADIAVSPNKSCDYYCSSALMNIGPDTQAVMHFAGAWQQQRWIFQR